MSERVDEQRRARRNRVLGASTAGVAALFAVAPVTHAVAKAPAPASPTDGGDQSGAGQAPAQAAAVEPNFGTQKIRIGVQIKDGSWVPEGTQTGGTVVSIHETGPGAGDGIDTECTTVEGSEEPDSTETFCAFDIDINDTNRELVEQEMGPAAARRASIPIPWYIAAPGDTVTMTQKTVNENLLIDPDPQTVEPCVLPTPQVAAEAAAEPAVCSQAPVAVTFNDPGLPPSATDDTATTLTGHSVGIDALANDETHGAPATLAIATDPEHGTAGLAIASDSPNSAARKAPGDDYYSLDYKPDAGFVGTDSFTYELTTPNGKATAKVTVTVTAPPPIAHDDKAHTTENTAVTIDVLANDDARGGGTLRIVGITDPANGRVLSGDDGFVYTPDDGFIGSDTFEYTIDTPFGRSTATVTVAVSGAIAETGVDSQQLTALGLLLLATGGAASVAGRRRYRARHSG